MMIKHKVIGGVGLGLVMGAAIGMAAAKQKKKLGHGPVGKAVKRVGCAVEELATTLGL